MTDYIRRDALREARNLAIRAYENANVFNADAIRKRLKPLLDAVVDTPAAYCPNCGAKMDGGDSNATD